MVDGKNLENRDLWDISARVFEDEHSTETINMEQGSVSVWGKSAVVETFNILEIPRSTVRNCAMHSISFFWMKELFRFDSTLVKMSVAR